MRINNTARTDRAGSASAARRGGGSSATFSLGEAEKTKQPSGPRAAQAIAGVDALLAIQGVDAAGDALSRKKRAVRRGHSMLDTLEELKLDLLAGAVSRDKLERLLQLVEDQGAGDIGEELSGLLDEIELRARVELAKHARH